MIDEHSREDELMVQIIGLQGKIERLKKEKEENVAEFLTNWKWGNALKQHIWSIKRTNCNCPHHTIYWKWFKEKWEKE